MIHQFFLIAAISASIVLASSISCVYADNKNFTVIITNNLKVVGCEKTNSCYMPNETKIGEGGKVIWINNSTLEHTVTSGKPTDNYTGILFDSNLIHPGENFTVTFPFNGTYFYFCQVHPWMTGRVIVGNGGPIPSS